MLRWAMAGSERGDFAMVPPNSGIAGENRVNGLSNPEVIETIQKNVGRKVGNGSFAGDGLGVLLAWRGWRGLASGGTEQSQPDSENY
jgi:hypothetical protein